MTGRQGRKIVHKVYKFAGNAGASRRFGARYEVFDGNVQGLCRIRVSPLVCKKNGHCDARDL